jgi:hypothetical protein
MGTQKNFGKPLTIQMFDHCYNVKTTQYIYENCKHLPHSITIRHHMQQHNSCIPTSHILIYVKLKTAKRSSFLFTKYNDLVVSCDNNMMQKYIQLHYISGSVCAGVTDLGL